jgi:hypothetical protein
MNRLPPILLLLSTSLLAQSVDSNTVRESRYAIRTLQKYCTSVETLSASQQPRMFAQVSSVGDSKGWAEFASKAAWTQAGKPKPLALVWYNDTYAVRVAITSGGDDHSYADYCYRRDGSLAQFRPVPEVQTNCDQSFFHCDVKFRGELRVYPRFAELPVQVFSRQVLPERLYYDGFLPLFPLKPEKLTVTFAEWPEYLSVWDLPFNQLLYMPTTMTK